MPKEPVSILIVDDDQTIRQILKRIVVREGFQASEASDGLQALTELENNKFEFVISDIHMPNMDGFELLEQIRIKHPQTMVVLITGYKDGTLDRAKQAGADGLITKPFKNTYISRSLNMLLARRLKRPASKSS